MNPSFKLQTGLIWDIFSNDSECLAVLNVYLMRIWDLCKKYHLNDFDGIIYLFMDYDYVTLKQILFLKIRDDLRGGLFNSCIINCICCKNIA